MLGEKAMDHIGASTGKRSRSRTIRAVLLIGFATILLWRWGCSRGPESKRTSAPQLPAPQFSVPSGVYAKDLAVGLTAFWPSAVIRYTLDGSDPTSASRKYFGPIKITESTLLKAKV